MILSFALSDKEGKDLTESIVIRDIRRIFPKLRTNSLVKLKANDAFYAKESLKKYTLDVLNKVSNRQRLDEIDKEIALAFVKYLKDNFNNRENKQIYDKNHKRSIL